MNPIFEKKIEPNEKSFGSLESEGSIEEEVVDLGVEWPSSDTIISYQAELSSLSSSYQAELRALRIAAELRALRIASEHQKVKGRR